MNLKIVELLEGIFDKCYYFCQNLTKTVEKIRNYFTDLKFQIWIDEDYRNYYEG